jgi:hypothetical protein
MKIAAEVWKSTLRILDCGNEGLNAIAADIDAAALIAPDRARSFDPGGLFSDGLGAAGALDRQLELVEYAVHPFSFRVVEHLELERPNTILVRDSEWAEASPETHPRRAVCTHTPFHRLECRFASRR